MPRSAPRRWRSGETGGKGRCRRPRKTGTLVAKPAGLSFTEKKRLDDLPDLIARLESEIGKLNTLLADPEIFTREPVKFRKATEALAERQTALEAAETEWLDLAERA
jgi:ATP-binding cassette subfamily F protein uup